MLKLSEGQGIDFGGLAKGYATDRLVQIFDEYGIKSAYFHWVAMSIAIIKNGQN